jgi:signal transduction histidine kinase
MRALIADLGMKKTYPVDFALVPVAIVLIEISVFFTQLSSEVDNNLTNLFLLRSIHTLSMLFIAYWVSQIYKVMNKTHASFGFLAMTGVLVIALGDLTHFYLANLFDIELVGFYRRFGIILIQGSLWFPAFLVIGGNRHEIFHQFKEYENRLIIATRGRSRASDEFRDLQINLQDRIRKEFRESCEVITSAVTKITAAGGTLAEQYSAMRPHLAGESLRRLSRELDDSRLDSSVQKSLQRNRNSLYLFVQQFQILSDSIARSAPLGVRSYAFVLIALVTPPYINFYSLIEFLISYPVLVIIVFVISRLIVKTQSGKSSSAMRRASILVFITGLLPFIFNSIGQAIYHDPQTQFPIYITAVILPLVYFLVIKLLQVLRPSALNLIRNDQLAASDALQGKVRDVIKVEFTKNFAHEWAVFIHGKVLTRLAATSLKLDAAASENDRKTYEETVESLLTLLRNPDADFDVESKDLQQEIASRLDPWRGLLHITLHIDQEIASLNNSRVRELGEVVEELISNSIRHGKAKNIDLKVYSAGVNEVEIIAVDDATIPPGDLREKSGLGTRIFNLASDGRWSLTRKGSSTEFRLTMGIKS